MKNHLHIPALIIGIAILLSACATSRHTRKTVLQSGEWTSVRSSADFEADWHNQHFAASASMRAFRDSIAIISVNAILGIEAARLTATPQQILLINRLTSQQYTFTYPQATTILGEQVTWPKIQDFVAGHNSFQSIQTNYHKISKL